MLSSKFQTKEWRCAQPWYMGGKATECEKYQASQISSITCLKLEKVRKRLNISTLEMAVVPNVLRLENGFEWTEDFDFYQTITEYELYYNLKFIVGTGGAQTRSLREVYHFIECQCKFLNNIVGQKVYFINILDGDICYTHMNKFKYLQSKYADDRIFIGDMKTFLVWFNKTIRAKMLKKNLGQFYTVNCEYILRSLYIPPKTSLIIEPFAGAGHLVNYFDKNEYTFECYDIDPKQSWIEKRDVLDNPPKYSGKFILTNPPYLSRNKTNEKKFFDRYNVNDLYKCFIQQLILDPPSGGILILPLNFWSSTRSMDVHLRKEFLSLFHIDTVNIFEERVFKDTSSSITSFRFERRDISVNYLETTFHLFPSQNIMNIKLSAANEYTIGGEVYNVSVNSLYKIGRLTEADQKYKTNIMVKCIDTSESIRAYIVKDKDIYIDTSPNKSARSYLTLSIEPTLDIYEQGVLVDCFNRFLSDAREKYGSIFLPSYREYARKRVSFELVYRIFGHLLK